VSKVPRGLLELQARLVLKESKDHLESLERPDHKVIMVVPESPV
jgi:hypothetical protein